MKRRDLLFTSAKAAGAIAAAGAFPQLLASDKPAVCLQFCSGPSCSALGMVGTYPHCYPRNFQYLNLTLTNQVIAAHKAAYWALLNRTITNAQLANLNSLRQQWTAHLSVYQTGINEASRQQYAAPRLWTAPTQPQLNFAASYAQQNGFNPSDATALIYNGSPMGNIGSGGSDPQLQSAILNLPNYQAMDQLSLLSDSRMAGITVAPSGICQIVGWTTEQLGTLADYNGIVGGAIGGVGVMAASEALISVGGALGLMGMVYKVAQLMCME